MAVTIEGEEGNLRVLRIRGLLRKSEWDAVLPTEVRQWGPTTRVKVLVILEDFKGWERGADWGDITFFDTYGDQIDKIAIVADAKWEAEILAFAGAGFRRAPVKFFPMSQLTSARAWLG
jgi:SpoIIAA-like